MESATRLEGECVRSGIPDSGASPSPLCFGAPAEGTGGPGASLSSTNPPNLDTLQGSPPGWPTPSPVDSCSPEWKIVHCLCRVKVVECGCNRLDCRRCAFFLRTRRSASLRDRLEPDGYRQALLYTVFTVPEGCRLEAADPKVWTRWRRRMWKWLKKNAGGLYAVERTDPGGKCDIAEDRQRIGFAAYLAAQVERDPSKAARLRDVAREAAEFSCDCSRCRKWHPHLNLLWVQRPGWSAFQDLNRLKAAWAEIIGVPPVVDVFGKETPGVVLVEHQYAAGPSEKAVKTRAHWYSYMGRTWSDWRNAVPGHLTIRWLGRYPRKPKEPEYPETCEKCGAPFETISFGTLESAETLCRAGPVACRAEIRARRRIAFIASQASFGRLTV